MVTLITRAQWGARAPKSIYTTTWAKRTEFVVHYSGASPTQTVRSIQNYCMDDKGHSDIDYNALVDTAGRIYEGRTGIWLTIGSHNLNRNTIGIGVCYIGDQSTPVTEAARTAIRWLYDEANRRRRAAGVSGTLASRVHSDFRPTSCPGDQLRAWVRSGMPAAAPMEGTTMYCKHGDKTPQVKSMQLALRRADPAALPKYGADQDYGGETARELARVIGSGDGMTYGPDEHDALMALAYRGPKGDPGSQGLPGQPGKTPTRVRLAETEAVVVAAS